MPVVSESKRLPKGTVIIAGGGPVGLLLARILSFHGIRSTLFERNETTTKWPKMDLTNARSMELFRKLGLADDLRKQGVSADIDQNVLISTGLSADKPITMWELPGVEKLRQQIRENNDGTQPREPWQRISQSILERWLKAICDKDPLVDLHYGSKVESLEEEDDGVTVQVTDTGTGVTTTWVSDYVAGCDGASSRVRKSLAIPLDGGPVPSCALLVHFRSHDLSRLHKHGRFWHTFLLGESGGFEAAIISQNEKDIWTTHLFMPLDANPENISSEDAVYRVLGGLYGPYKVEIDEILVRSVWRPNIAVARSWGSPKGRVYLAGDAVHQNIPTGGYGMNMGIGDAFDLGWKLAAVINGYGGPGLLRSYEAERRPVALRSVERSGVHFQVHSELKQFLSDGDPRRVDEDTEEARALRQKIHHYYQTHDGENKDIGIEMGYRYRSPVILCEEDAAAEPPFDPRHYVPTSWPGGRPPHVFLSDGKAIFDTLGDEWSLLVFSGQEVGQDLIVQVADAMSLPLVQVELSQENHAKMLYERNLILIRPDHHVAWRGDGVHSLEDAERIIGVVTGKADVKLEHLSAQPEVAFTSSIGMTTQVEGFTLDKMAAFQQ